MPKKKTGPKPSPPPVGLGILHDADIARREGISRERVRQLRIRAGIPCPPKKGVLPDSMLQDFAKVWNKCKTPQEVVERTGKSLQKVRNLRGACLYRGMPMRRMDSHKVKREDFIELWNSAETLDEVVGRTGADRITLSRKAHHLRKQGYPLKTMEWWRNPEVKKRRQHFVNLWNSSRSVPEVVKKTGLRYDAVSSRASYLRTLGYPLKKMPKHCLENKHG